MAKANPFRFSTKFQDDETDLLYYGHRYYNASTGRWLSRDLMQERGGANLCGFVKNAPLHAVDAFGLAQWEPPWPGDPGGPPTTTPWPLPTEEPPDLPVPVPTLPSISDAWRVCCRPLRIRGLGVLRHCDMRQTPCDPDPKGEEYPVTRDPQCCKNGIKTDLDMSKWLRKNPTYGGHGLPDDNCQSSTRKALATCCARSPWKPSWYAYPIPRRLRHRYRHFRMVKRNTLFLSKAHYT